MGISFGEIAARYGCELHGDPDFVVTQVATLAGADGEAITFLANSVYRAQLETTSAGAVILAADDLEACPVAALVARDPYIVYAQIAAELHPAMEMSPGVDPAATVEAGVQVPDSCQIAPGAVVESGAVLGESVYVGANSVIGPGAQIGDDTRIFAGVVICHGVRIGRRCIFHGGVVVGADGFGIAKDAAGGWIKVPQLGSVNIGDDVEIGANSTIDRGAIEDTEIGEGVKLDNQVQVAHNVVIGAHTAVAALVGISGSTRIGARCLIGGHTGFAGHITVSDDVMISAGTAVMNSIKRPGFYGGVAATVDEASRWRKNVARYRHLDEMARRLHKLEKLVEKKLGDE
jgi:UDP-3-O-[3-hydroxymyristoyl] glucosamine N-acyltransferase